jgi:XRE family transcriptional regulator, stress-response regulator
MAEKHRDDVARLDLQTIVGSRLREQRLLRGASLRDTAIAAGISPGHLSDIENGNSHASLPTLLRLCRALHLPIADLLPRLGGRRIRETVVTAERPGSHRLSHRHLELRVDRVVIEPGGEHRNKIADDDMFAFIVAGSCRVAVAGVDYDLGAGDGVDIERAGDISIGSADGATVLLVRAGRR